MSKTSIHAKEWAQEGFNSFVKEEFVAAPHTEIQNRAQVSNTLKASMGIERIIFNNLDQLKNEVGPQNQIVYEVSNKDSRIRFAGGWQSLATSSGNLIANNNGDFLNPEQFIEVTFYGTALNLMFSGPDVITDDINVDITIDGSSVGISNIGDLSNVLRGRNYRTNMVVNIVSGLALGWHTVKLAGAAGSQDLLRVHGVEFINESSAVDITPGNAFAGTEKSTLLSNSNSPFNAGTSGTKGSRVVKYLREGQISEAVQLVDATQGNLTSANHSNEEIARRINFREFGANRSDDFSTLSTSSDRAFTLDDGSTTLVGDDVSVASNFGVEGINLDTTSDFLTLTFIGTGLDIVISTATFTSTVDVAVDGVSIGTISSLPSNSIFTYKIVSGLPYGTHNVKLTRTSANSSFLTHDFIIYGPKKPEIPTDATELCDYNIVSDFIHSTNEANLEFISQGVIRKQASREMIYVGAGWTASLGPFSTVAGGNRTLTSTASDYIEYTFYGTGFIHQGNVNTGQDFLTQIDGNALTAANFPSVTVSTSANYTYNNSTGRTTTGANANNVTLAVTGLSLGVHTVRFTNQVASNYQMHNFDIITPIHTYNTKVGSLSLLDTRKTSPIQEKTLDGIDLSKAKAWATYNPTNGEVLSSNNISAIIELSNADILFYFDKVMRDSNYSVVAVQNAGFAVVAAGNIAPNFFQVSTRDAAGSANTASRISVVVFGELEDEGEDL